MRSTPERAVRVRALPGKIVLCSWARHLTLTVPISTQVFKWVPANLMLGGNPAMDQHPIQGGVEILVVASCYRNRDKLRPGGPQWPVCRLYLPIPIKRLLSKDYRIYLRWSSAENWWKVLEKMSTARQSHCIVSSFSCYSWAYIFGILSQTAKATSAWSCFLPLHYFSKQFAWIVLKHSVTIKIKTNLGYCFTTFEWFHFSFWAGSVQFVTF